MSPNGGVRVVPTEKLLLYTHWQIGWNSSGPVENTNGSHSIHLSFSVLCSQECSRYRFEHSRSHPPRTCPFPIYADLFYASYMSVNVRSMGARMNKAKLSGCNVVTWQFCWWYYSFCFRSVAHMRLEWITYCIQPQRIIDIGLDRETLTDIRIEAVRIRMFRAL